MSEPTTAGIIEHFAALPDPRIHIKKNEHKLIDIITIAVCAIIRGADNWNEVAQYGVAKRDWSATFLELPNGVPSHDTFNRIFFLINPEKFQRCFSGLIRAAAEITKGQVVAIDGMGCQKKIVKKNIERGGDYAVAVKGDQPGLFKAVDDLFAGADTKKRKRKKGKRGQIYFSHCHLARKLFLTKK